MKVIKKHCNIITILAIALLVISPHISGMEPQEQREEAIRLQQSRQQQQNQNTSQQDKTNKKEWPPRNKRQSEPIMDQSINQPMQQPRQSKHQGRTAQQPRIAKDPNNIASLQMGSRQSLLDQRDTEIQRLSQELHMGIHNPQQLHQLLTTLEELQNPIPNELTQRTSQLRHQIEELQQQLNLQIQLESKWSQRIEQQQKQEQMQQERLLEVQKQIQQYFDQQEQQKIEPKLQLQECSICLEEKQDVCAIPCKQATKNPHSDLICTSCLKDIKQSTNACPICRGAI